MRLIIEDNDEQFKFYLLEKIESLAKSKNLYVLELYTYIQEKDFEVRFVETDRTDYRGEAWPTEFTVHKTPYETYDSLCWLFFHELGHLVLMNSEFESVFKCAKAAHYKECGFEHEHGIYWNCEGYYDYYDKHHDADPEENIVSLFATHIVGVSYDRTWWQKQKAALLTPGKEGHK